ncbi:caspase-6-like [Temnothorax curvispinosus]|uniref:Caspase-6-like n=1 Tax=Temnothorax curvispinosus TaxID=300111 RepID=A0A6J1Q6U9_9HYME|nr:caspase-6-like [Temnothorax curvispinosus]
MGMRPACARFASSNNNDCLCVITLTHGVQNDLIYAKDVIYKSDRLWKSFASDKCITLVGKPKLFSIQACRGDESDNGVMLSPRTLVKTETDLVVTYAIRSKLSLGNKYGAAAPCRKTRAENVFFDGIKQHAINITSSPLSASWRNLAEKIYFLN